jgi:hypothetical protein
MAKWQIPGGSVAVVKDGRLILARGKRWPAHDLFKDFRGCPAAG